MTAQTTSASYEVGYRKPPRHTQFQKGQSGNPGGRPRRPARRPEELALYEAYRATIVMEDGRAVPMPAIQAVLRSQLQSAAGGNVRAQRDILAMIRDIELVRSIASPFDDGGADDVVDDADDADAIGGADDDEPARQQAEGIDTYGERRQEEREPVELVARVERSETREHPFNAAPPPPGFAGAQPGLQRSSTAAPHAVRAPPPEDAAGPPAGRTPSLPSGSGSGQRRGVLPRRNGPRCACTATARAAPPQSGGQRRQNPGGAFGKLAALAGPDQSRTRPGPGCRRVRPRAGRPYRARRKIENSLLNSLLSGNLPACTPGVSQSAAASSPEPWSAFREDASRCSSAFRPAATLAQRMSLKYFVRC
jgi:hypothetical protein